MKKIFLMRHSIPEKGDMPNEQIPLSEEGKALAVSKRNIFSNVDRCFSSPYRRAMETAEFIADHPVIVKELHERTIGDAREDFWLKQYEDHDFRNPGGESLNQVKVRMKTAIDSIVGQMEEGETALVVSHATAICAYLLSYCEIEVKDFSRQMDLKSFLKTIFFRIFVLWGEKNENIIFDRRNDGRWQDDGKSAAEKRSGEQRFS